MNRHNDERPEVISPATVTISYIDLEPTGAPPLSRAFSEAGGKSVAVTAKTTWTPPRGFDNAELRCDEAVDAILNDENVVPEPAIATLEKLIQELRRAGQRYVRAEVNLSIGYRRMNRLRDSFEILSRLIEDEPSLSLHESERIAIWINYANSAWALYKHLKSDDTQLLYTAHQAYERAIELTEGTWLGPLSWGARVAWERGMKDHAVALWRRALQLVAERPDEEDVLTDIINRDSTFDSIDTLAQE